MEKKTVYIRPRHYRFVFLVEHDISWRKMTGIIQANMKIWGGRYNPIIPVKGKKISDAYLELLKKFDPDIIFYSPAINIDEIRKMAIFQPSSYVALDMERNDFHFGGIDYHYLLSESNRDFMFYHQKLPILHVQSFHQVPLKAKEFYQTNFGLFELYAGQDHLIRGYEVHPINKGNHTEINKLITEKRPYFKSILSQLKVNCFVSRPDDLRASQFFELIVADPSKSNEDLFYFWNRQQYVAFNKRLFQIVVSIDDLELLFGDPDFGGVLQQLAIDSVMFVTSRTLSVSRQQAIIKDLQTRLSHPNYIRFEQTPKRDFPYPILDQGPLNDLKEATRQVFTYKEDLLKLPKLQLNDSFKAAGNYVFDIEVETEDQHANRVMYPYSYSVQKGRINRDHFESMYVTHEDSVLNYFIPSDEELIHHRLRYVKGEDGKQVQLPIEIRTSNAGQRMFALVNLFKGNWFHLCHTLEDKFWLDLFRYTSEFKSKESNIPSGKGIFSVMDLKEERRLLYEKYKDGIDAKLKRDGTPFNIDEVISKYLDEDFKHHISDTLQDLIDIGAIYMGIKILCSTCGSNKWYPLKELQNQMNCSGCNSSIIPKLESTYYYRTNEIIINNLLSDVTSDKKHFHGNYVVLRALDSLKRNSSRGFSYCCSTDFLADTGGGKKLRSDIDILAVQDGKLILGEAKTDATDFNNNEINNLIWLGKNIKPDKIIMAYFSGKLGDEKIQRVKDGIANEACEVITYHASKPRYWFGGLFGFPK